ncbi:hypothetical protein J1G44_12525 [Cellulomonas sp. zg-ZUI199]|uniref:Polysaccharide biosynthesis protein C-terminal domain-containing protein n=1 Tax=Cellulomonas wangleii TaxID=2816956 RepID=A0ABX8D1I6_9CELL|nr:hypothetical protein [Cellulomonas wangleii]MBO0925302.1 hypothetical protein [Cellulomonas wangleii]QVI61199.1 hypothetical protein KG103_11900 [Cellulomonas wangleii]
MSQGLPSPAEGQERPGTASRLGPALVAVARMAPLAVQLLATPFVIASLGASTYAVWALMITTINLLMTADLGVVSIMQRFHGVARGRGDVQMAGRVTATVLAVLGVVLVLVTLAGPLAADVVLAVVDVPPELRAEAYTAFRHTGTIAVLQLIGLAFSSYLAAHERFVAFAVVSLGARLVLAAGIVVALTTGAGLPALVVASYADAAMAVLLGAVAAARHLRREVRRPAYRAELGEMWSYAWRNQLSGLGFVAQRELDVLLAGVLLPTAAIATVTAAAPLTAAVCLAPVVLLTPLFTRLSVLAAGDPRDVAAHAHEAERTWFRLAVPYAALTLAVLPPFAAAWVGPDVSGVAGVTALLAAGYVLALATSVVALLVRAVGEPGIETGAYAAYVVVKIVTGVVAAVLLGPLGLAATGVVASLAMVLVLRRGARSLTGARGSVVDVPWALVSLAVAGAAAVGAWGVASAGVPRLAQLAVFAVIAALAAAVLLLVGRRRGTRTEGAAAPSEGSRRS